MLVRKFYAVTSREALRMVREALGPDALILSNRRTDDGIEIMAVAPSEVETVTAVPARRTAQPSHAPVVRPDPRFAKPQAAVADKPKSSSAAGALHTDPPLAPTAPQARVTAAGAAPAAVPASSPAQRDAPEVVSTNYELVHEVRLLRSLVEGQLAALAWNDLKRRDPAKGEMMRQLIAAGFGAALSREIVDELPSGLDLGRAIRNLKLRLQQRLHAAPPEANLVEGGGILALVG